MIEPMDGYFQNEIDFPMYTFKETVSNTRSNNNSSGAKSTAKNGEIFKNADFWLEKGRLI